MTLPDLDSTYEAIASELPLRLRWDIEEGMSCFGDSDHQWDMDDAEFMRRLGIPRSRHPRRECVRCHVTWKNPEYQP